MTDAVIVSTARTALTKSWRGSFNMTHGATLGGHVVAQALNRAKIDPAEVEDVIIGCANPEGATGLNIARQIAHQSGLTCFSEWCDGEPILFFWVTGNCYGSPTRDCGPGPCHHWWWR